MSIDIPPAIQTVDAENKRVAKILLIGAKTTVVDCTMSISHHVNTTIRSVDNHSTAVNASADDNRNTSLAVIEVAVMATVLTLAVFGNLMVVLSLTMKTRKMSRMHLMLMHLSLADLFVAFFNVLPQMMWDITFRFQGGPFLCGAVKYLQLVAMYASSYVLLSTAIDRYVAICHPFVSQKWTSLQAHLLVLAAWLASLVFSIPQVFIFSLTEVSEGQGVYDCWDKFDPPWTLKLYITWNTVSVFIVPTLILAVLYGQISFAVWRSSKMVEKLVPYSSKQSVTSSSSNCHHATLLHQGPRESCQQDLHRHCAAKTTEVTSEPAHSSAGHPDCTRRFRSPNGLVHTPPLGGFARSGKEEEDKREESGRPFAKSSARRVALLNWRLRREGPCTQQSPGNEERVTEGMSGYRGPRSRPSSSPSPSSSATCCAGPPSTWRRCGPRTTTALRLKPQH
ncbi:hypothetical protein C0Q70_00104 [Pomacea canaliculata]|uniref:G-protein coupled receptors family 1 profile domain-containing protein n=1 Tax=Pomacea canaliculata TaxID=400727 RepID=A0A2T7PVT9_POMCA|nr:hypothetical protein C0Q70_00104 [Pomacea canaliculata]